MFSNNIPKFDNGLILKGNMLENIERYSENFISSYFKNYSRGIISGVNLSVDDNYIIISPGILKNRDKIYIQSDVLKIEYKATGRETIIKIRFIDSSVGSSFVSSCGEVFLDDDLEMKKDEFELGRFNIKSGFLTTNYNFFKDFKTGNNINIINTPYSHIKKYTLNPLILKCFGVEMLGNENRKIEDIIFFISCLQNKVIGREKIIEYLKLKKKGIDINSSNEKIYKALLDL